MSYVLDPERMYRTPTHFVYALHELETFEYRAANITRTVGGRDFSDQRIPC